MADPITLEEAKRRVRERLLGRLGVHAVGLRRRDGAVSLYWDPAHGGTRDELGAEARPLAEPYDVVIIEGPGAAGPRPTGK